MSSAGALAAHTKEGFSLLHAMISVCTACCGPSPIARRSGFFLLGMASRRRVAIQGSKRISTGVLLASACFCISAF